MALDPKSLPPELIATYLGKKCGFFVGAGLSRGVGFPDWKGFLIKLIDKAESSHFFPADKAAECRKMAETPAKFLMLAEEMKEALGAIQFKNVIEATFLDKTKAPGPAHELLVKLQKRMFIVTTNYDMLIEDAFVNHKIRPLVYKYYEAHALQRSLFKRQFFVLKAHGDAETAAEEIVLTEKDYRHILYREPGYQSVLQSIFTMYSAIFLGSSLDDPELKLLLNYINAAFPEGGVEHYALMSTDSVSKTEQNRWLKDYNVRIIPISSADNYKDVQIFLEYLMAQETAAATPIA